MVKRMHQDKKQTKSDHGYFSYFGGETAARIAQLRERQSAERDVAIETPAGSTLRVFY